VCAAMYVPECLARGRCPAEAETVDGAKADISCSHTLPLRGRCVGEEMEAWWKVDVRRQRRVETTVVVHELRFVIVVVIWQVTSGSGPFGVAEAGYSGMFQARIGERLEAVS
jgi:hypothetical protein